MNSPLRIFAGWWVVAGAFVCMLTGYTVTYSFAAFFGPLKAAFGAQRGETSLVFSISAFLYFLLGLPAGLIADRLGPRPVVAGGLLTISLGSVLAAEPARYGRSISATAWVWGWASASPTCRASPPYSVGSSAGVAWPAASPWLESASAP